MAQFVLLASGKYPLLRWSDYTRGKVADFTKLSTLSYQLESVLGLFYHARLICIPSQ